MRFKERSILHDTEVQGEAISADVKASPGYPEMLLRSLVRVATLNNRFAVLM